MGAMLWFDSRRPKRPFIVYCVIGLEVDYSIQSISSSFGIFGDRGL